MYPSASPNTVHSSHHYQSAPRLPSASSESGPSGAGSGSAVVMNGGYPPTPSGMDSSFGITPSPSTPYSQVSPSSFAPTYLPQPRAAVPPYLLEQYGLTTPSPRLPPAQGRAGSSNSIPNGASPGEQHIRVRQYGPYEGVEGTTLSATCDVNFPSSPPLGSAEYNTSSGPKGRALRIVFGNHPVPTRVSVLGMSSRGPEQLCQVNATVPDWAVTGSQRQTVPVSLQVLAANHIVETVSVGGFQYMTVGARNRTQQTRQRSQSPKRSIRETIRGRQSPSDILSFNHHPRRQILNQTLESPKMSNMFNDQYDYSSLFYDYDLGQATTLPSLLNPLTVGYPSEVPQVHMHQYQEPPPLPPGSYPEVPPPLPQGSYEAFAPPLPLPLQLQLQQEEQDQAEQAAQPVLVRSSQLPPSVPMANSYLAPLSRARLEIHGDPLEMTIGWTDTEWSSGRRIVQFWRRQWGPTLACAFRAIPLAKWDGKSIVVSCIYRADKNQCCVTSVDVIYLLEALVATRFTVEEKNRIRRNLEGYHPTTVSKNRPATAELFKTIMGFSNPRPRNIEKDVKVFSWDTLVPALHKIMGKYESGTSNFDMSPPEASGSVIPAPISPPVTDRPLPLQDTYY